jgi:myosin heavy subunit
VAKKESLDARQARVTKANRAALKKHAAKKAKAAVPAKKRRPKDTTQYDLRGIRNDIDDLQDGMNELESMINRVNIRHSEIIGRIENLEASHKAARAMEQAYDALTDRLDEQARHMAEIDKLQNAIVDANIKRDERFKDHGWFIYQFKRLTIAQWFKLIFRAEWPTGG